jgi:hypothetical protein
LLNADQVNEYDLKKCAMNSNKKNRHVSWPDLEGKGELMSVYIVPDYDRSSPDIKLNKHRLHLLVNQRAQNTNANHAVSLAQCILFYSQSRIGACI